MNKFFLNVPTQSLSSFQILSSFLNKSLKSALKCWRKKIKPTIVHTVKISSTCSIRLCFYLPVIRSMCIREPSRPSRVCQRMRLKETMLWAQYSKTWRCQVIWTPRNTMNSSRDALLKVIALLRRNSKQRRLNMTTPACTACYDWLKSQMRVELRKPLLC